MIQVLKDLIGSRRHYSAPWPPLAVCLPCCGQKQPGLSGMAASKFFRCRPALALSFSFSLVIPNFRMGLPGISRLSNLSHF